MKGLKIPKGGNQNRMKSMKIPKRGNQNPYIEEEHTTQWSKEKVQKDKQQSTKHISKTKDRVTRTPLKSRGELRCSRKV
jgi:gas vesicle protein